MNMKSVPNPLADPPIINKNKPIPERKYVNLIRSFLERFFSSMLINFETNIELKNMATNKDDPKTIDKVIGR